MVMQSHYLVNAVALPPRTPGSNGCKWVCFWSERRTRVRFPNRELNWRGKADEVEQPFRAPIKAKNPLDRPRPPGAPAGLSIEFAMVRSSPQRFDSVLSIILTPTPEWELGSLLTSLAYVKSLASLEGRPVAAHMQQGVWRMRRPLIDVHCRHMLGRPYQYGQLRPD